MIAGRLESIETEVMACVGHEGVTPEQLAARLGVRRATAVSYILLLASEGRLRIEQVSLPGGSPEAGVGAGGAEHRLSVGQRRS